jgi:hypothetical protein
VAGTGRTPAAKGLTGERSELVERQASRADLGPEVAAVALDRLLDGGNDDDTGDPAGPVRVGVPPLARLGGARIAAAPDVNVIRRALQ